jgi:outer membrane protein OmpA-like peptidoglycan-associated protein
VVTVALAIASSIAFTGCASWPRSSTTVVLLPDEDGHVGAVSVSTAGGAQKIDQAFHAVVVTGAAVPLPMAPRTREAVDAAYADLMKAQPSRPESFILFFQIDSTTLTAESEAKVRAVIRAAHKRRPTEITVFGHADASGTEKRNLDLSAERARAIAALIRKSDPTIGRIDVQFFGDKVPLVSRAASSDARGPEPQNRRVEVLIL